MMQYNINILLLFVVAIQPVFTSVCGVCECSDELTQLHVTCIGYGIRSVPQDLPANMSFLHILNTSIAEITQDDFKRYTSLLTTEISKNRMLTTLGDHIFQSNVNLSKIIIKENSLLSELSEHTFDGQYRGVRTLDLSYNNLYSLPNLAGLTNIKTTLPYHLHLDGNPLTTPRALCSGKPDGPGSTCVFNYVTITYTQMSYLHDYTLNDTEITLLNLSHNTQLEGFDDNVFNLISNSGLYELILSDNPKLKEIPNSGIDNLRVLRCQRCPSVLHVPPTIFYTSIEEVHLTYTQHCCAFKNPHLQSKEQYNAALESKIRRCEKDTLTTNSPTAKNTPFYSHSTSTGLPLPAFAAGFGRKLLQFQDFFTDDMTFEDVSTTINPLFANIKPTINSDIDHIILHELNCSTADFDALRSDLICTPSENSFIPCVDILEEKNWLRACLWIVAILALVGNFVVLAFTISSRTKAPMTVTKFLICNLAFSDILQGIYLLTLAIVDIKTLGNYFNYATWWQKDGGCDVIGFITVFASELSVYTLSVITLERWYAISHAIHLTKRVQMKQAIIIMLIGWIFAATLAMMPLLGFSSYEVTSLCLPFKFSEVGDKVYVWTLLLLNLAAFCLVFFCYVSIFLQVRGSNASMASDTYLARRMAVLVFTDFFCWGPVAIVAALSAGGVNLQKSFWTTEDDLLIAKVILVIFYPFNACANPFLYAIFTKQFRKDCLQTLNYTGLWKRKIRGPIRRRLDDSGGSTRQNLVRNSQSHVSNTTQLTNASLSQLEHTCRRGSSIKSKSSAEALVSSSLNGAVVAADASRNSGISIKQYAMVDNSSHASARRKYRPGSYMRSMSCSASTIDSIDSRRPSDPIQETQHETESDTRTRHPTSSDVLKAQWHTDRWLSETRSKDCKEQSNDVDSGTEMQHVNESEFEEYEGLLDHQNSITSSCSHRRPSYTQLVNTFNSFNSDNQLESSNLAQHYKYKPSIQLENNNLSQEPPTNRIINIPLR